MDWRGLLRNRWVWLAAGVGAVAGVITLVRRRSGGGEGDVAGETSGYSAGGVGYPDTTANDIATQLGQREAYWDKTFADFTRGVEERLDEFPTGSETPTTPTPGGPSYTPPPPTTTGGGGGALHKRARIDAARASRSVRSPARSM